MSKPSRDARRVERVTYKDSWNTDVVNKADVLKLLRAKRAAVRRMVKRLREAYCSPVMFARGYRRACDDILRKL